MPPTATRPHAPSPPSTSRRWSFRTPPGSGPCGSSTTTASPAPVAPTGRRSASSAPRSASRAPAARPSKLSPRPRAASTAKTKRQRCYPCPNAISSPKAKTAWSSSPNPPSPTSYARGKNFRFNILQPIAPNMPNMPIAPAHINPFCHQARGFFTSTCSVWVTVTGRSM